MRNDRRQNRHAGQRCANDVARSTATWTRALLTLGSLTLSLACVDLTPPWTKVTSQSGGSMGNPLDTGAGSASDTGDSGVDGGGVVGGAGGSVAVDGNGVTDGTTIPDAPIAGGITGSGGGATAIDGAGGVTGTGGGVGIDSPLETGGVIGMGGGVGIDGPTETGGLIGTGGAKGTGGKSTGGAGTGGKGTGGAGTGGKGTGSAGTGGKGTGGSMATGGTGAGGSHAAGCGTTQSTFAQTLTFSSDFAPLAMGVSPPSGASLAHTTTGPPSNPTLCAAGCAVLSMAYFKNMGLTSVTAGEVFSSNTNLLGASLTFNIALDDPGTKAPIQVEVWAGGDAISGWTWGTTTRVSGTGLAAYDPANGFTALTTVPPLADKTTSGGTYCAAATFAIGVHLQNTADITTSTAGPVTIYIGSVTITPPL